MMPPPRPAPTPVSDTQEMISRMRPWLDPEEHVFASFAGPPPAGLDYRALATFREEEGLSMILPEGAAPGLPMRRIILRVHSSLKGVGLTAAVASALAEAGIACNVVAAFHHDHVFIPAEQADEALTILLDLQAAASGE
ncbi:ACT domain-containing protein [Pseudooceanicola sp. HF7]|uniref:ACT domain-containing protein n=1 Tax=Pseudooceanicola sp. HF7 TaxID=2721560 RepID=UPI0020CA3ADF|nr:ACT domain-containing protein [Pseudooceanicola sp. HF7]